MTTPPLDRSEALGQFLSILPRRVAPILMAALAGGDVNPATLEAALAKVDWTASRSKVEDLLTAFLPVEELVPENLAAWRPVVRDGFSFIGARLSPERLVPKIVEQITLSDDASLETRVMTFIRRVPSLQKIGQTIARNADLNPELRARLAELEDGIREVDDAEIRAEARKRLRAKLTKYGVHLEPGLYAEGSVSALLKFTRREATGDLPRSGVLKVLKPFITAYFREDLDVLSSLARYFDQHQKEYNLGHLSLGAMMDDIRDLFERETDFVNERANLASAAARYAGVPGVRVPTPLEALSTDTITAMTEERSVKITDAFADQPERRAQTARKLAECLVARPLFSTEDGAPFQADPHAGNLRLDEATGDIVLLDWALTDSLSVAERRSLILLYVSLPLRDEGQMAAAVGELSGATTDAERAAVKKQVELYMDGFPAGGPPPDVPGLVERMLKHGARFSSSFLIFRKMIVTLGDVIGQLSPTVSIGRVVADFALDRGLLIPSPGADFKIPLSGSDVLRIALSAQSFLPRVWLQTVRSLTRNAAARCPTRAGEAGDQPVESTGAELERHRE